VSRMTGMLRLMTWVVAALLPVAAWLPAPFKAAWQLGTFTLILGALFTLWAAMPRYGVLWPIVGLGFVLATLSALPYAENQRAHWIIGAQLVIWTSAGPFAVAGLMNRIPRLRRQAVTFFVLAQSISAVAAVIQMFGREVLGASSLYGRAPGLAGHQNILGLFSGVALILLVAELRRRRKGSVLALTALNGAALLASGSLSASGALILGLVVLLAAQRVRLDRLFAMAVLGGATAWAISVYAGQSSDFKTPMDRYLQVTGQTHQIGTVDERMQTVRYALLRIQERPLTGWGLDDVSGGTYDNFTLTHNVLIRAWYQGGVIAFLCFLVIFAMSIAVIARSVTHGGYDEVPAATLTVVWFFAMTAATFQQGYLWVPLLAAWAALEPRPSKSKVENGSFSPNAPVTS
jgi:O-antigen ligase